MLPAVGLAAEAPAQEAVELPAPARAAAAEEPPAAAEGPATEEPADLGAADGAGACARAGLLRAVR